MAFEIIVRFDNLEAGFKPFGFNQKVLYRLFHALSFESYLKGALETGPGAQEIRVRPVVDAFPAGTG